jgi:hypothetical protein
MADWYDTWVTRHATTFGLVNAQDMATMASWRPSFEAAEYTGAELNHATDSILLCPDLLGGYAGKMTSHLQAIRRAVTDHRSVRFESAWEQTEDRGTCVDCGGSGRVIVPHIAGVKDGAWLPMKKARANASYYTMAVICSCIRGRLMIERLQKTSERLRDKRQCFLTLAHYATRNPNWRTQMEWREKEFSERAKLNPEEIDRELRAALDRLIEQNQESRSHP